MWRQARCRHYQTSNKSRKRVLKKLCRRVSLTLHLVNVRILRLADTNPNYSSYFKGRKLDYPNANTPKASRKYVKAMKKLQVSQT